MSPDEAPNRTLQVLSLSKKTTTDTLRKEYEKFGMVENAFVVWDHAKNENKGYGFVTYRAKAGADNALKSPAMKIDSHDVVHALASEGNMHHLKEANARSLIVRHISRSKTTEESLRETFEQFGEVESTHVVRDTETGESKGFGFVTFREKAAALQVPQKSIKLHGKKVLCLPRMARR
ncbi:hypothetical protein PHYSODRAFT_353446 [Phytophthora sojae]|uniref:RRM domain-containing protein n=1 Tax=Phytophthora sojae (strain P6497) TaxID=1094619 RepID=G4YM58_PHYSP|nr:hypothetical protein PHYSODRAFT_353446 [Phytophthora sojae]EGZ27866.1 hypothetical protein PHYSODRAFT_353446 [Phytophthora sojae]|eukprot:XP_009515141.1 hypothetical protein PHYSODRAFT_353446 [Phytophthora sojae]